MDVLRMLAVYSHLLVLMVAVGGMALTEYAVLGVAQGGNAALLTQAPRMVVWALAGLWVTGTVIVGLDTQFAWPIILSKPKLLAKLSVVVLMTGNGVYLHQRVLPWLRSSSRAAGAEVSMKRAAIVSGALSAACWVYAVFLGVAKPLGSTWGYAGFMGGFAVLLGVALVVACRLVPPRLTRLQGSRAVSPLLEPARKRVA